MQSLTQLKVVFSLAVFVMALIGGVWPFIKRKTLSDQTTAIGFSLAEAFAGGVFLGAGLLHMLPTAAAQFLETGHHYPWPFLIAAASFFGLLFLEHAGSTLRSGTAQTGINVALIIALMLSLHSLLEGAAVGLAVDWAAMLVIFIAIMAHKGVASFALATELNRSSLHFVVKAVAFIMFALMTPLGIYLGNEALFTSGGGSLLVPIFNSLAAGTFLYIGILHGLEQELHHSTHTIKEFAVMLLGFLIMAVLAIWV